MLVICYGTSDVCVSLFFVWCSAVFCLRFYIIYIVYMYGISIFYPISLSSPIYSIFLCDGTAFKPDNLTYS